ncbi:hypothetical protein FIE12Z_5415 [Fusarium flagelliforme]|uniref:Uncharacterized protein n=1 Tax=Fusarium flagelliforme TaxID=2675880 RepID=A0A395MQN4_9HYPO|nr:hypothetical protein FIE12Z_5415 [Fusarium flagelliforme]
MNPFQRLPNETIDAIFIHMHPIDVWRFQQSSKSSERALDPHLLTRPYALNDLMTVACVRGNNGAIRKAVSLGANVSMITLPQSRDQQSSTILCASRHLDTVAILFDLGARLDMDFNGLVDTERRIRERGKSAEFLQLCSERGVRDQFINFQDAIDHSLFDHVADVTEKEFEKWNADDIDKVSILLELGANSTALSEEQPAVTTLSYLIKNIGKQCPAPLCLPIIKLLLSKHPDLNAPSRELTQRVLESQNGFEPAEAAKLDVPVQTHFQPLFVYAYTIETPDSPGYDYLCSHGAKFEPIWQPGAPMEYYDSIPIFRLCQDWVEDGGPLLLNDGQFGVTKVFIERGAVKNVGIRFIKDALRPMMGILHRDANPSILIQRSHTLLKLVLQDGNLNSNMAGEMDDLLLEIVEEATVNGSGNTNLEFSDIVDPLTVALLLGKGAKLTTRAHGNWATKDVRDVVVSHLENDPYNITCDI